MKIIKKLIACLSIMFTMFILTSYSYANDSQNVTENSSENNNSKNGTKNNLNLTMVEMSLFHTIKDDFVKKDLFGDDKVIALSVPTELEDKVEKPEKGKLDKSENEKIINYTSRIKEFITNKMTEEEFRSFVEKTKKNPANKNIKEALDKIDYKQFKENISNSTITVKVSVKKPEQQKK